MINVDGQKGVGHPVLVHTPGSRYRWGIYYGLSDDDLVLVEFPPMEGTKDTGYWEHFICKVLVTKHSVAVAKDTSRLYWLYNSYYKDFDDAYHHFQDTLKHVEEYGHESMSVVVIKPTIWSHFNHITAAPYNELARVYRFIEQSEDTDDGPPKSLPPAYIGYF